MADQPLQDHSTDYAGEEAENKPGQQQLSKIKVHAFAVSSIVPPRMSVIPRRASA